MAINKIILFLFLFHVEQFAMKNLISTGIYKKT
jgi:hypothetical protein